LRLPPDGRCGSGSPVSGSTSQELGTINQRLINAAAVLAQLDDQLDTMLADWTAALISNLEGPTTKGKEPGKVRIALE
jgi:hypothetical protein